MMLGLGPVARQELITTARQGRYDWARVDSVLFLLFFFALRRASRMEPFHPGGRTFEQVHQFTKVQSHGTIGRIGGSSLTRPV